MAILNYTTTISVDKTLAEIQGMLARGGARSISVDYGDDATPAAVSFLIRTPLGEHFYALPANMEAIYCVLERQYRQGKVRRGFVTQDQAARVGWRIIKDWLEAQLAIIEAGMVSLEQVMLPYQLVEGGKTLFEAYREHAALPAPTEA